MVSFLSVNSDVLEVEVIGFLRLGFEADIAGFTAGDLGTGEETVDGNFPLGQSAFRFPDFPQLSKRSSFASSSALSRWIKV